jgi:ATP adenylyltransferase
MHADQLLHFIQNEMSMTHIYQPLIIRVLVESGGAATVRQLATEIAKSNEVDLQFYERVVKRYPKKALADRKLPVVEVQGDLWKLTGKKLTFKERMQIRTTCDEKMGEFLSKRGEDAWFYQRSDVPSSTAYQVIARSKGVCEACGLGAGPGVRLEVDHIEPQKPLTGKTAGKSALENLQALCRSCNAAKSNKDSTDYRPPAKVANILKSIDPAVLTPKERSELVQILQGRLEEIENYI